MKENIAYTSSLISVALLMINLLVLREPSIIIGYLILAFAMVPVSTLVAEEFSLTQQTIGE
jgi:hypothetical protein